MQTYKDNRICLGDKGNAYTLFINEKPIVCWWNFYSLARCCRRLGDCKSEAFMMLSF